MDKKSKIFFLIFFLLIVGSVAVTYWRIMVKRDYIISASQDCDPAMETCFVYECDPEGDEECAAAPEEERVSYYKTITKNAKNISPCDPYKNECPTELTCEEGEAECEIILCDEENVPEGESCNDPVKYLEENPPEEECNCGSETDTTEGAAAEEPTEDESAGNDNSSNEETGSEEEKPACDCGASEETAPAEETAPTEEQ
ncbi:MAG: hypothetical protein V1690_02435 [Candidatus Moraniibacteriota bacterium]